MNNLLTGIMTKTTGSALATAVGNRIYLDSAPEKATLPYVVFFIVSAVPFDTFSEDMDDIYMQFSLFSSSKGATEITGLYANLTALFDDCTFSLTGGTLLSVERENLTTMTDDITTTAGTIGVKHWAVDYRIKVHYA